jgi:hypothetical protein
MSDRLPGYDRWLCDGPRVYCDDCGADLGRLHDGRGHHVPDRPGSRVGRLLCEDCAQREEDDDGE